MKEFAILVDSATDVPKEYADQYPIYIVPLQVVYSEGSYRDGVDITAEQMYDRFPDEVPSTSLPSGDDIHATLTQISKDGFDQVLVVNISSGLSGTHQLFQLMAEEFPQLAFSFVDTRSIGMGAGIQVMLATKYLAKGYSIRKTCEKLQDCHKHAQLIFCIPTLEYLRKGGRIGLVSATVGSMLGIKPLITCNQDGVYETLDRARGWKRALSSALEHVVSFADNYERIAIGVAHSNAEKEGKELLGILKKRLPHAAFDIFGQISPVLIAHTGPGLLGVCVQAIPD